MKKGRQDRIAETLTFYCKKRVSITPILYIFSVALGESINLKA